MIEELQLINYWLQSKDYNFPHQKGIDNSYFFATQDIVSWVNEFNQKTGKLPSLEITAVQFESFKIIENLDPIDYLISVVKEQKAYVEYRPVLTDSAKLVNDGKTIEAMWKMRADIDDLLKKYTSKMTRYDWTKNALDRYDSYMKKHGNTGLAGLTTGIRKLDDLTGGWRQDDLVLLAGRTNEGKSFLCNYFAYVAWRSLQQAGVSAPVIYITTEMPELEISYRLDTLRAHFSNRELNEGKLADHLLYKEYLEELSRSNGSFLILSQEANGSKAFTPADIRAIIEAERPALVVVDQLYDLSDGTGERDIRRRIVNISNQIREVNLYTSTPVILVAQASRNAAKEAKKDAGATPDIFDIQESDNPAQKATRVITLRMINDVFKLSLKKNRGGKKDEDIFMRVDLNTGIWEESTVDASVF